MTLKRKAHRKSTGEGRVAKSSRTRAGWKLDKTGNCKPFQISSPPWPPARRVRLDLGITPPPLPILCSSFLAPSGVIRSGPGFQVSPQCPDCFVFKNNHVGRPKTLRYKAFVSVQVKRGHTYLFCFLGLPLFRGTTIRLRE